MSRVRALLQRLAVSPAATRAFGREVEDRAYFEALSPLRVDDAWAPSAPPSATDPTVRAQLLHEGYAVVRGVLPADECAALAAAAVGLVQAGKPATFVYAYDAAWALPARLETAATCLLGGPGDLLSDVWAFHVPPRDDAGGWPPHRGMNVDVRHEGSPTLLTAWVALTDAPPDGACMHFLPRHRDRAWPHKPRRLRFPVEHGRAVPLAAGDAVLFDANVVHWGGASSGSRPGPRVSITYSFARRGFDYGSVVRGALPFARRLDVIAQAVRMYASREPGPTALAARWARSRRTA